MDVSVDEIWTRGAGLFQNLAHGLLSVREALQRKRCVEALAANAVQGSEPNYEVAEVLPAPGFTAEDLVKIAAAAQRFSEGRLGHAVLQKAHSLGLVVPEPEDLHCLPGGIHCWVGGVPTLVGSRAFVARLGIDLAEAGELALWPGEVFIAQGSRLVGKLRISES